MWQVIALLKLNWLKQHHDATLPGINGVADRNVKVPSENRKKPHIVYPLDLPMKYKTSVIEKPVKADFQEVCYHK